ncbi:MAG: extracellular solute-binding protein [Actinomycetota bacterium]|nr:extracellular solute-binding protein [Actinomycetota bacterium]
MRLRDTLALVLAATLLAGCGGPAGGGGEGEAADSETTLTLAAYTATEPGWSTVVSAFSATREGRGVEVTEDYGASVQQAVAVEAGEPADVVNVSAEPDITLLVQAGKVDENWDAGVTRGIPFGSVVALVVRPGNPKDIRDWDDLLRDDVEVVTPSPLSSGSGRWNLLAPYAWASDGGQDPQAGLQYVTELATDHVAQWPDSAGEATEVFARGGADVLLTSENEARNGDLEFVIPAQTLAIESPVAVVSTSRHLEQARDLVNFQFTPEAQKLWAEANFRPVDPAVRAEYAERFPAPEKLWTVGDLGGWEMADRQFFDEGNGTIARIYRQATG